MRLDVFLAQRYSQYSRSVFIRCIQEGRVRVNGIKVLKKSSLVHEDDDVSIEFPQEYPSRLEGIKMPLCILEETKDYLVLSKQSGISVHPSPTDTSATLVHGILAYCPEQLSHISGEKRPGIVHRLDKNTSGVLVIAKNDSFHRFFVDQLQQRKVEKIYRALVHGKIVSGTIDAPIARHPTQRIRMAIQKNGKHAVSHVHCLGYDPIKNVSLVSVRIETGRTHQIRVHLSSIGHPIVGDSVYYTDAPESWGLQKRHYLHAHILSFMTPEGVSVRYTDYLQNVFECEENTFFSFSPL